MVETRAVTADDERYDPDPDRPNYTPRECELLVATLRTLRAQGYDRMTMDAVAACAHTSKRTIYRRWPTKHDLILAAVRHAIQPTPISLDGPDLRANLIRILNALCRQADEHGITIRELVPATSRNAELVALMQCALFEPLRVMMHNALVQAVELGEIEPLADNLVFVTTVRGYFLDRTIASATPLPQCTAQSLVDDVLIPSLQRPRICSSAKSNVAEIVRKRSVTDS